MPQSLSVVYIHFVFSTKERFPYLQDEQTRNSAFAYMGSVSKQLDCIPVIVGGTEDHVHILASLGRMISQSEWVKEVKRISNVWLKDQGLIFPTNGGHAPHRGFASVQGRLERFGADVA